jgi:hypothetical protein
MRNSRPLPDEWLLLACVAIVSFLRLGFTLPAADFLFVLTAIVHLALIVLGHRAMRWSRFHLFAGAYLGAMLVSALLSAAPRQSLVKWIGECYLIAIAVIAFNIMTSEASIARATLAWLGGAAVNVAFGLAATIAFYAGVPALAKTLGAWGFGSLPVGHYARVYGLFLYPNMACTFYIGTVMLAWMAADRGWVRRRIAIALGVATSIAAILTLSPGLGGLVLAPCIVLWIDRRARLVFAAGIVVAILSFLSTLPEPAALHEPSSRILVWREALQNIPSHPFFGRGIGLGAVHVTYTSPNGHAHTLTDAHNTVLNLAAEGGLITAAAFLALVIHLLRGIRWSRRPAMFLGVAFICGFLYQDLTGSFEDTRHEWVLIGMLISASALGDLPEPRQVVREDRRRSSLESLR